MRERRSGEERKAQIVEATLRLADQLGPDRLSTEAIARDVGLTQPGVFRHFPSKDRLWEAVAARIGEMFQVRWTKVERLDSSSREKLRHLITGQLKLIRATPAIPAILFSRELHVENDGLRKVFFGLMQRFHGLTAGLIEDGQREGEFGRNQDPQDAAFLVIGLVQGLVLRWSLSGRSFDLVAEGERLLDVLLRGFRMPGDRPAVPANVDPVCTDAPDGARRRGSRGRS